MRKFSFLAFIFMFVACQKSYAQSPYRASVGGVVYGTAVGASFKAFFTDKVAFQMDMLYKGTVTGDVKYDFVFYFALETNLNIVCQKKLKDKKRSELFGFIGGGVSLGYALFEENGKFGINAICGLEFVFKNIPLDIQIDLRPGYGLLYNSHNIPIPANWFTSEIKTPWSHFDWAVGVTLRYAFKEK